MVGEGVNQLGGDRRGTSVLQGLGSSDLKAADGEDTVYDLEVLMVGPDEVES